MLVTTCVLLRSITDSKLAEKKKKKQLYVVFAKNVVF